MPDWCEIQLTVSGPAADLDRFITVCQTAPDYYKGTDYDLAPDTIFTFSGICPMPEEIVISDNDDWYRWCVDHWGTKWDACDLPDDLDITDNEDDEKVLEIYFQTAWCPPDKWLKEAIKMFSTLTFELYWRSECGVADYLGS